MTDGPTTHREVERKVRVPDDLVLPALVGVAVGITDMVAASPVTLVAAYHDTQDLRLIRWGVTLRRREGGGDDGWHLKLPVPGAQGLVRDEVRLPLEAGDVGEVPGELADLVRALVREAPLVHVATVRTHRTTYDLRDGSGAVIAEVADDRVEVLEDGVAVRRYREIEVEARQGVGTVLEAVEAALVAAGGTPTTRGKAAEALGPRGSGAPDVTAPPWPHAGDPAREAIRCVVATQVRAFLLADVGVRRGTPDAVHQMRVAARTLRSALRAFAPLVDRDWASVVRSELSWIAGALAAVRDTEVHRERLEGHAARLPSGDREHAVRVVDAWLRERLDDSRAAALLALRSERHLRLLTDLVAAARDPQLTSAADGPAADALAPRVQKASQALTRAADSLTADSPAEQWHRARIVAKRARYAAETTAPVLGKRVRRRAQALEEVTDVLGDLHDSVVARRMLSELAGRPEIDGRTGFALGLLHGVELDLERSEKERFAELWPHVRRVIAGQPLR